MREIKFRLYDYFNEEWLYSETLGLSEFFKSYEMRIEGDNKCVIEQYTGLCDKNEKKIYEGDILLYEKGNGEKEPTIIEYIDDMFHCKSTKYPNLSRGNYRLATLHSMNEIIGNIHEHSNLLK